MRSWMALLALVPACGFNSGAKGDGGIDTPEVQLCFGTFAKVCLSALPSSPVMVVDADLDIDTSTGPAGSPRCDPQIPQYCVVAGTSFMIASGKKLRGHGSRPLVLVSTTAAFEALGEIDVSSHIAPLSSGPGADSALCTSGTSPSMTAGGYGGSFGGKGGNGSSGKPATGTTGLSVDALAAFPTTLRGGCPGGSGMTVGAGAEGSGGNGGGALAVIAPQIRLDGRINASGAAGHGGPALTSGGGGGGSGGMIVLDSASVSLLSSRAQIWANGGGGAQGGAPAMAGSNGNESAAPDRAAAATNGSTDGANGGAGSLGSALIGSDGQADARDGGGGGGGGGGAGFIHASGVTGASVISPASSELPASAR